MADAPECPSFIAIGDFSEGDNDHQPTWPSPVAAGFSVFNGQIVFTNLPRDLVEQLLPKGLNLSLAANTKCEDFHPVLHLVGEQTQTGGSLGHNPEIPYNQPYEEFILIVPFVLQGQNPQWHNFVVRMYLNSEVAEELGKLFGYRKKIGQVAFDSNHPRRYEVTESGSGALVFSSFDVMHHVLGSDAQAEAGLASYRDIKTIVTMPVLGVVPDTALRLCSQFKLDFGNASIAAITTNHSYTADFDPPDLDGIQMQSADDGAVFVRGLRWTLALPAVICGPAVATAGASDPGEVGPSLLSVIESMADAVEEKAQP